MKLAFFTVPVFHPQVAEDELNGFLASHRIVALDENSAADSGACNPATVVNARSAQSNANDPGSRNDNIGFRLAAARMGADVRMVNTSDPTIFWFRWARPPGENSRPLGALVGRVPNVRRWGALFSDHPRHG